LATNKTRTKEISLNYHFLARNTSEIYIERIKFQADDGEEIDKQAKPGSKRFYLEWKSLQKC
jgi:hypothetical protein